MGDDLLAALHAAIDDCDEVGWDDARTSDLRPEAVHAAIDAAFAASLPGSLDAAWAEAEAALPDGWNVHGVERIGVGNWHAAAWPLVDAVHGHGPTPAAALRALAERLRDRP
jgi:hypothetical protein